MIRRRPGPLTEREAELWAAFLDAYLSTRTRGPVDLFLRALVGAPAKETP